MMQEAADRTVTWQSQWHVKTSMASMKHPPGVGGGGEEQGAWQVKAEREWEERMEVEKKKDAELWEVRAGRKEAKKQRRLWRICYDAQGQGHMADDAKLTTAGAGCFAILYGSSMMKSFTFFRI